MAPTGGTAASSSSLLGGGKGQTQTQPQAQTQAQAQGHGPRHGPATGPPHGQRQQQGAQGKGAPPPGHGPLNLPSAAVDGRQIAASNSTLNAWVGRRQPVWLAKGTPVQPTPRPARPPPTLDPLVVTAPSHPVVVEIAASSYRDANTTTDTAANPQPQPQPQPQVQSRSPSAQPQQPSSRFPHQSPRVTPHESPSESPRQTHLQLGSQISLHLPAKPAQAAQPSPPAPVQPLHAAAALGPPRLSISSVDPVLPSPAPSDDTSPSLPLSRDSPGTRNPYPLGSSNDPPTTLAHFVVDGHVSSHPPPLPHSRDPASTAADGQSTARQGITQVYPTPVLSSTVPMALNTPPTPVVPDAGNPGVVPSDASRPIAPKRRRVDSVAFLESLGVNRSVETFLREIGGEFHLQESLERPRFYLLSGACRDGDVFFLAFHQLFCSWTMSPASVHELCQEGVHDTSLVDSALGTMGTVMKANTKIRDMVLRWFANFPLQLPTLRVNPYYSQAINQVLDFLMCVSKKWTIVNHEHILRGYPLLMKELINTFHLYSPILQSIVFRASRRTLGAPDQPIGIQMDSLFRYDQKKHQNPHDGTYTIGLRGDAYDEYNNTMVASYQALLAQCKPAPRAESTVLSASSPMQSPDILSPTMFGDHLRLQPEMAHGFSPAPLSINTGRTGQSVHSPSPTYPPVPPNINTAFTVFHAQPTSVTGHAPSSPIVGMGPSPQKDVFVINQHGHYEYTPQAVQQIWQQLHMNQMLRDQQMQQPQQMQQTQQQQPQFSHQFQQQQQQLQNIYRRRSQPRLVPSQRPSPVQTAYTLPSQLVNTVQPPIPIRDSVPDATAHHLAALANPQNLGQQQRLANSSSLSPRVAHAVQPSSVRPRPFVPPGQEQNPEIDRLIPPPGMGITVQDYPHTPYDKRSIDSSLHQAHLRSPQRVLKTPSIGTPPERYYQAIKGFALEPTPLAPQTHLNKLTFNLADTTLQKLTLDEMIAGNTFPVNRFSNGSLRIRLRCCNQPMPAPTISDHVWVTLDTAWPDHIFINLNDQVIETKRKQHHSRDLPIDISPFICPGTNTLCISILASARQQKPPRTFFVAVEIIEVLSHSSILRMIRASGSRPASETRELIQRRLGGSLGSAEDDHDLEIPSEGISVDLADPFTARIFTVPVRGKACAHLECFDLENWLNTRLGKRSTCVCGGGSDCRCPKEPSFVDKWKCPLCNGDARPYSLRIDEFLLEIRNRLEQNNQLRAKSIMVLADGSWKTNESPDDDDDDVDSDDNGVRATSKQSLPRDVIEIDDD
ncbi:hypothetical protein F5Y14DRAFT_79498 [Nemania sp. NC0429]|nr:hypothetical protein F5Y14DRAFT_79498 [Nemania sp. NC0429]